MAATVELRPGIDFGLVGEVQFRMGDEAECLLGGMPPARHVALSAEHAVEAYTIYCSGEVLGFCGFSQEGFFGPTTLWLLTTDAVERHKVSFVKFARWAVEHLHANHDPLRVLVDARYAKALALAGRLGFQFAPAGNGFVMGVIG